MVSSFPLLLCIAANLFAYRSITIGDFSYDMASGTPPPDRLKDIARAYLQIIDSGRYEALIPILSDRIVYRTIGPTVVGPAKLIQYYRDTRVAGHGSHEVTGIIAEGNQAAVLLRMKAEMTDGTKTEFDAVDLFTFEGEKIVGVRTFSDLPPALPLHAFASSRAPDSSPR